MRVNLTRDEWTVIFDALGVAMVASLDQRASSLNPCIPCDFETEAYEELQAKLSERLQNG